VRLLCQLLCGLSREEVVRLSSLFEMRIVRQEADLSVGGSPGVVRYDPWFTGYAQEDTAEFNEAIRWLGLADVRPDALGDREII